MTEIQDRKPCWPRSKGSGGGILLGSGQHQGLGTRVAQLQERAPGRDPLPRRPGTLTDQHPVLVRVASVFNDGNDVGAFLCYVEEIPARPVGELHSIDQSLLQHTHHV